MTRLDYACFKGVKAFSSMLKLTSYVTVNVIYWISYNERENIILLYSYK